MDDILQQFEDNHRNLEYMLAKLKVVHNLGVMGKIPMYDFEVLRDSLTAYSDKHNAIIEKFIFETTEVNQ